MDEKELERRLSELSKSWRIPEDPPLDAMWQAIEVRAFPPAETRRPWRWTRTLLPMAAVLLLGFGLGQLAPSVLRSRRVAPLLTAAPQVTAPGTGATVRLTSQEEPFVGIATDYLERVTALLVTMTDASRRGQPIGQSISPARDLLATTRLLIDSPQAGDPRLQALLQDLELVFAQIVRLPRSAPTPDVYLIDQTLDQREVLPRLRVMLAENPTSQP